MSNHQAGEYIDMTMGIAMGISTMAAAALGNTISDVAGVGLGGFIESMAQRLGLPPSKLSRSSVDCCFLFLFFGRALTVLCAVIYIYRGDKKRG